MSRDQMIAAHFFRLSIKSAYYIKLKAKKII